MILKLKYGFWIMGIALMMPIIAYAQTTDSLTVADTLSLDTIQIPPMARDYHWLSYRGKADIIDTGGTRSCNFYMVNRKDSILYLNIHSSGIELIRVVFTPDSVTYVNKLTYQYYKGTYLPFKLLMRMPLDFDAVQRLFNGQTEILEDKLRERRIELRYEDFVEVDSTRSFFTHFRFKELNRLLEIDAVMKVVRLDVPGPTSIRIPDKFEELKF